MTRSMSALALSLALATPLALPSLAPASDAVSEFVGQKVEDFTLPRIGTEGSQTFSKLKGKVVLMSFWASWCGPCRKELPAYEDVYAKYKAKGLEIIAISVDKDAAEAQGFLAQLGKPLSFGVLLDDKSIVMGRYDVVSMPTSMLIGRDGTILFREVGFSEEKLAGMTAQIEKALAAK